MINKTQFTQIMTNAKKEEEGSKINGRPEGKHSSLFFSLWMRDTNLYSFLHLISKDGFTVPEVKVVFWKMHSDSEILQIEITLSLIGHKYVALKVFLIKELLYVIFHFWRTTGKPSSIYKNIFTLKLFRQRICLMKTGN